MNDFLRLGQIAIGFIYFLQGVIATAVAFNHDLVDNKFNMLCIALWAIGFIGNHILKQSKRISNRSRFLFEIIWSSVIAVGWSAVLDNSYFLLLVIFVQWMTIILFMSKKICDHVLLLHIVFLAVLYFGIRDDVAFRFNLMEFIASVLVLFLVYWISINTMKLLINHEQRTRNQEKSMDNIMKVLEMKCYEAREATKSKSDFLANMSHEIRTPINSVLGMNEMILRECEDPQIRTYATNVKTSGRMLLSLINDILDFSKIESGKMDLVPAEYQLSSLLNDVCNMIKSRAEENALSFEVEVDEKIPDYLYGDEVRIKQIVVNLLTNAVKYTDSGKVSFVVKQERVDDNNINLKFDIIDTGKGIRKEDIENLFVSFKRVDETKNRNIEGSGLGLAITSRLVDLMQGSIGVESEYGKGSTFSVSILQKVKREELIGDFSKKYNNISSEKSEYRVSFRAPSVKILIVDDVRVNILVAKSLLKQTKLNADVAFSGRQAIEKLKKRKYDAVLLDHMMPDLDGIETLSIIKQEKIAEGTPFIALTANALSGAQQQYLSAGFDDYLSKPIEGTALEKMLIKWLPKDKVELCE